MINYDKLKNSLKRLEEQHENYLRIGEKEGFSTLDKEAIKESVIQRFETSYDTLWKHLKKHLEEVVGIPEVPNGPKPIFRMANENNLLDDIEKWFVYAQARIDTSHDYSEEKSKIVLEKISDYLKDSILLFETISNEKWQ